VLPFLLMAIVVAALVFGVIYLQDLTNQPQVKDFNGNLTQTLDDLRGSIEDNTR
jgi:hypothetical protein